MWTTVVLMELINSDSFLSSSSKSYFFIPLTFLKQCCYKIISMYRTFLYFQSKALSLYVFSVVKYFATKFIPGFKWGRVVQSVLFCIVFGISLVYLFVLFLFGYFIVCSSSIYYLWLPIWYLQIFLPVQLHSK